MNAPHALSGGRLSRLQARLDPLRAAHAQTIDEIVRAEHSAATLLAGRKRPPRDLRRQVQRDRDRLTTRRAAIEADMRQLEAELAALQARLAVVQAELAQLDQREHPLTAGMTITEYSERFFALQREQRELVGGEPEATA